MAGLLVTALVVSALLVTPGPPAHASARPTAADSSPLISSVMVLYRDQVNHPTGQISAARLARVRSADPAHALSYDHQLAIGAYLLRLTPPERLAAIDPYLTQLKQSDPQIQSVDANAPLTPTAEMSTNDPFLPQQWNFQPGTRGQNNGIHALEAWDEQWQPAAFEGGKGYVNPDGGPRLVRYGEYSHNWNYKLMSGDFDCTDATFGDPADGTVKRCEVAASWTTVADEDGSINLRSSQSQWVRFGWGDSWNFKRVSSGTLCTSGTFGDPWRLQRKICQVEVRPDGGGVVALEGDTFTLPAAASVRFGYRDRWVYAVVPAGKSVKCAVGSAGNGDPFTQDPYAGQRKHCEVVKSRGYGATVAVLDTGALPSPDQSLLPGWNFIDNNGDYADHGSAGDGCPEPPAWRWHGFKVASVVGAVANNGVGIAGVAPMASVQIDKVHNACVRTLAAVLDAAVWAAGGRVPTVPVLNPTPARVVNFSAGDDSPTCPDTWKATLARLKQLGAILVASAGNSPGPVNSSPANCTDAVVVTAHTQTGALASFASYGPTVDLSAPGVGIQVLTNLGTTSPSTEYGVESVDGTSVAAPQVAAVAALMLGKNPTLSADNLRWRLALATRPFASGCDGCGLGMLDAERALRSAEAITTKTVDNDDPTRASYIAAPADINASFRPEQPTHWYRADIPPKGRAEVGFVPSTAGPTCSMSLVDPANGQVQGPYTCGTTVTNQLDHTARLYISVSAPGSAAGATYRLLVGWW